MTVEAHRGRGGLIEGGRGYVGLLGLSVAHVILEYPLNWKTFIGIGGELRSRLASRPAAPA